MKKLMCATALLTSFAVWGAFVEEPNAISFEGYTASTATQLVNGVEYDEEGSLKSKPHFFYAGDAGSIDASTVKTFGGDNSA